MKQFLLKCLFFVVIMFLLSIAMELIITSGLRSSEARLFKSWNQILKGDVNADVIIIGNSRAYRSFNPIVMSDILKSTVWNLGMDAYSFNINKWKYDAYIKYNKKPKLIIINVDHATLSKSSIGYERKQFLPYLKEEPFQNTYMLNGFDKGSFYLPLYKYFGYPKLITMGIQESLKIKHYNDKEINGFWEDRHSWSGEALENLNDIGMRITMNKDSSVVSEFKNFVINNTQEGISVILVWTPIQKKALTVLSNNLANRDYFRKISEELGVEFLDYSDDSICDDVNNFANAVHMNNNGSYIFSKILSNDIKNKY